MKKILNISLIMVLALVIFALSSCEESDDYDYNSIVPKVQDMTGPTSVRGGTTANYRAFGRGGSTYDFSSQGAVSTIASVEDEPYGASVLFSESYEDATAVITVVETTMGGIASEPYSLEIEVTKLDVNITGSKDISVVEDEPLTRTYSVDFKYPGATYSWSVNGDHISISGESNKDVLEVNYAYPPEEGEFVDISVVVTTAAGNPITDEIEVFIQQFCPLIIDELIGDWSSNLFYDDSQQFASITEVDEDATTVTFMGFVDFYVDYWLDNWENENGLVVHLNEPESTVNIPLQYYGSTDWPEHFYIKGVALTEGENTHGVYNFCDPSITLTYEIRLWFDDIDEEGNPIDEDGEIVEFEELPLMYEDPITSVFNLGTSGKTAILNQPSVVQGNR